MNRTRYLLPLAAVLLISGIGIQTAAGEGTAGSRARAIHAARASFLTDGEPVTTTTIGTAMTVERSDTGPDIVTEAPLESTTTTTAPAPVKITAPMVHGHYDCTDDNACTLTSTGDPGPNLDESDAPEKTVAAGDAGYRGHLADELCAVSVTWCDVDSSGHYIDKDTSR